MSAVNDSDAEVGSPFVIVGAGGHGREVLDLVEALGLRSSFAGFVDDAEPDSVGAERLQRRGASVIGTVEWLSGSTLEYALAIGTSSIRRRIDAVLIDGMAEREPLTLIHPAASIGSDNRFDHGVIICAHATVTTNVTIGRHSHVNVGCSVQHDSVIGEFVTVSPGVFINGDVTIGNDVFFGTGAVVTRGCTIGDGATVGAGAVVLADVEPGARILGVPGRPHAR